MLRDPRGRSDDHRHGAAVDRPRRAGDVRGRLRAQEHDHGRDLLLGPEPPDRLTRAPSTRAPPRASSPGRCAFWSASPPGESHRSPPIGPGETEFTSTPRAANRCRRTRATATARRPWSPSTPCSSTTAASPTTRHTLTIRPQPRRAIAGAAARISRIGRHHVQLPLRLPLLVGQLLDRAHRAGAGAVDQRVDPPEPLEARLAAPARRRPRRSRRAPAAPPRPPASSHARATSASTSERRPSSSTDAPSPASDTAVARPMPPEAPVTMQARSRRPRSILGDSSMAIATENGDAGAARSSAPHGLTKSVPGHRLQGRRRARPEHRGRRDLRPARAQRRRQDHDRGDADHARRSRPPARAHVGTVDVIAHPALAKQLIGIVSQQNTLDRQLTVWENLYFHGRLFGIPAPESRRISDRLLEQFHLSRWAKASVYALSGGMAQRLMVARAIFHRPAVLFLDEPTAGLDPAEPAGAVGDPRRAERRRPDDHAAHALHGGGRPAVQPGGDHGSRQDPRARHAGRAQAVGRRGHDRDREGVG